MDVRPCEGYSIHLNTPNCTPAGMVTKEIIQLVRTPAPTTQPHPFPHDGAPAAINDYQNRSMRITTACVSCTGSTG